MAVRYEPKGMALQYAALACNLYRGCQHGCRYCFAPNCLFMPLERFHADGIPTEGVPSKSVTIRTRIAASNSVTLLLLRLQSVWLLPRSEGIMRDGQHEKSACQPLAIGCYFGTAQLYMCEPLAT
jgi:hypothetical protein